MSATSSAGLPPGQARALAAIWDHWSEVGLPPTYREIAARLGVRSTNGVLGHLKRLVKKGLVEPAAGGLVRRAITPVGVRDAVRAAAAAARPQGLPGPTPG